MPEEEGEKREAAVPPLQPAIPERSLETSSTYSSRDGEVLGWTSMGLLLLSLSIWMFRGVYNPENDPMHAYQPLEVLAVTLFTAALVLGAWSVLKAFQRN